MNSSDIRLQYDLVSLVEQAAGPLRGRGVVCPMPHHTHSKGTPSLYVYEGRDGIQRFRCFGNCGASGDVIDFVGFYHFGAAYQKGSPEWFLKAVEKLGHLPCARPRRLPRPARTFDQSLVRRLVMRWHRSLDVHARRYLEQRGILSVADRFLLGYRYIKPQYNHGTPGHYITIPTIHLDRIHSVKCRRIDTHPDYSTGFGQALRYTTLSGKRIGGPQFGVFNYNNAAFATSPLLSPEGEMDVMLCVALGFRAFSFNIGTYVTGDWHVLFRQAAITYLADGGEAGLAHARHKMLACGEGEIVQLDDDVGALYARHGAAFTKDYLHGLGSRREARR